MLVRNKLRVSIPFGALNVKDIYSKYLFPDHLWLSKLSMLKMSQLLKVYWAASRNTYHCLVYSPL